MAEAAYNLGLLLAPRHSAEAVASLRWAAESRPDQPRYAYTLAFFLHRSGTGKRRSMFLTDLLKRFPEHQDGIRLLVGILTGKF